MKKIRSKSKKGFTLVELIVVLVILAILAAMLVPALTGYIRRAREEKDYQFAATVLTAAQSAAAYQYAQDGFDATTLKISEGTSAGKGANDTVSGLVGNTNFQCNFTVDSNAVIKYDGTGWVYVNGAIYYLQSGGSWSAVSSSAAPAAT